MNEKIQQSIQSGRNFLAANQTISGRFRGLANKTADGFHRAQSNDNVFFTALILDCLTHVEEASAIRKRAAYYLLSQRSSHGTLNYWERQSGSRPYPDDLDDTACAIAAVLGLDAKALSATDQAVLARSLIACETQPGGPYVTWLMPPSAKDWRDVDVAVNANIGHMFARLGIYSAQLENYISNCITSDNLTSPYYVTDIPVMYFISRWYRGPQQEVLINRVLSSMVTSFSALHRAMLITAAINLGAGASIRPKYIASLLRLQHDDGWPPAALYFEPPQDGAWRYAGSPELTTAFAIEALASYQSLPKSAQAAEHDKPKDLQAIYEHQISAIANKQRVEVVDSAGVIARALHKRPPAKVIDQLNQGSVNGWAAYSMYDNLLDGDASYMYLGAANVAMRQSLRHFTQALPQSRQFAAFIEASFERMDSANTWELVNARSATTLPNYADHRQLADRSWGHVVAPTGVLVAAGFALSSREVKNFHRFMQHYLIAKQLCDDAHDWQDDIGHERITAVVVLLLKGCQGQSHQARQLHFWQHTVFEVNAVIRYHARKAQRYLDACYFFVDKQELQAWLAGIEAVCQAAENGRQEALQFIKTFTAADLVK